MTLDDALVIRASLLELAPDVDNVAWGPTLSFTKERRAEAIRIIDAEIEVLFNG